MSYPNVNASLLKLPFRAQTWHSDFLIATKKLQNGTPRKGYLAGCVPVMLQGIGGPGAPHHFEFRKRSCLGFLGILNLCFFVFVRTHHNNGMSFDELRLAMFGLCWHHIQKSVKECTRTSCFQTLCLDFCISEVLRRQPSQIPIGSCLLTFKALMMLY